MSTLSDQWVDEYMTKDRERRESRNAWKDSLKAQSYNRTAVDPSSLTGFYRNDPLKVKTTGYGEKETEYTIGGARGFYNSGGRKDARTANAFAGRQSQFVESFERAYQSNREDISTDWWMQFNPDELRAFGGGLFDNEAAHLETAQAAFAVELELQAEVDRQFEQAVAAFDNASAISTMTYDLAGVDKPRESMSEAEQEDLRRELELTIRGRGDENYQDEISSFMDSERRLLGRMRLGAEAPESRRNQGATNQQGNQNQGSEQEPFKLYDGTPLSEGDYIKYYNDETAFLKEVGVDVTKLNDQEFEELLTEREAILRGTLKANPKLTDVLTPGMGQGFIEGGVAVMGSVLEKGFQWGGAAWDVMSQFSPVSKVIHDDITAFFREKNEQHKEETIAEIKKETGAPDAVVLAKGFNSEASIAFEELGADFPEIQQEYIRMAGMDPSLALSFFQADLQGQLDPKEQLQYLTDLRSQEEERVRQVRDADFRVGDELLNVLAMYGRNVPGRLSTMFTLVLAGDVDTHGRNTVQEWGNFWSELNERSEYFDHTPSKALGMDGTVAGLILDLGTGIAFDPTTWIFGPRMSVRRGAVATVAEAKVMVKSPLIKQGVQDIMDASLSPSKGMSGMLHTAGWLDATSMGELLEVIGFNPQALKHSPWRGTTTKGMEVQTSFLSNLLEQADAGDDLTDLADNVLKNGFEEPVTVHVSRSQDVIWVEDGAKRIRMADANDISHVPVVLKVVDDVPAGKTAIPGYTDESVATFQKVIDEKPNVKGADEATRSQLISTAGIMARSPKAVGVGTSTLKDGSVAAIKAVVDGDGGFFWATDEAGEVIGAVQATEGSFGVATSSAAGGKGVMTAILDSAHEFGFDLMNKFQADSLSEQGASALQSYARSKLAKAVPTGTRPGVPLKNLLQDGEKLGSPLKKPGSGEVATVRADSVLPRRMLLGDIDSDQISGIMERAITERGVKPLGANTGVMARHFNSRILKLVRSNGMGKWVERYMTPMNLLKRYELVGPHAMDKILDTAYRLWGDDTAKLDEWLTVIMEHTRTNVRNSGEAARRLQELQPEIRRLQELQEQTGGVWDNLAGSSQNDLRRVVYEADKALREKLAKIDEETSVLGSTKELDEALNAMWDDYNRKYIGTNPAWKDVVDETGFVDWDVLRKGKRPPEEGVAGDTISVFSDDMKAVAEDMNIPVEELAAKLSNTQNIKLAATMPLSPLEMIMARELGASAYTRFTHTSTVNALREAAMGFHRAWVIDKVFTVATAATVSFDELLRIAHIGGSGAVLRWGADRATSMEARLHSLLRGKGLSRRSGAEHLSAAKQERLRILQDYPSYLKQAERQTFEQHGLGWTDIAPGEYGYDDAARQWAAGFLQDSGFRAFLKGKDSFREWFFSPDGERLRRGNVVGKRDGKIQTQLVTEADEFFNGWEQVFEVMLSRAKKSGKYDQVKQSWNDVAQMVEESGGLPKDLPDVAINHLGPVRGIKRDLPGKINIAKIQEGFFDRLFMDPVNYRRGFLADLVRTHEKSRLTTMFESAGKQIVSDAELEHVLGLQGMAGGARNGLRQAVQEMALKQGYIPQSYLDDLVEKAVLGEIENTLYAFDVGSRLGAQSRVAFPFGKPWADMAAFWGKEVMRKPALRGWINNTNAMGLRSMNDRGLLSFPVVPNRTAAMLSRLAHTDFTIDKGLIGDLGTDERPVFGQTFGDPEGVLHSGGILPGSDQSDFSPLFFLPTAGENPFSAMIPGLGIVPITFLDYFVNHKYDPIEQPQEYQNLIDEIGDYIPSIHFQQGGYISRVLGGGSSARIAGAAVDVVGMAGGDSFFNLTSELGDIGRELDRTREVSALLADPAELELLLSADSAQEADQLLQALVSQADKQASQHHLAESVTRYMAPVSNVYNPTIQEVQNVWLEAASLEGLDFLEGRDPSRLTDEDRSQVANDIRTAFFDLPQWKRDVYLTKQPALAVNLVGSWEWTPAAINEQLPGSEASYRSGGTPSELALHETYVRKGWIRPVQPIERARRILGVIKAAEVSSAKELYSTQLKANNEDLWTYVQKEPVIMEHLQFVVDSEFGKSWDIRTVEEAWYKWNTLEADAEAWIANDLGIEAVDGVSARKADLTEYDGLQKAFQIPDDFKPWGQAFPGLEEEDVSDRVQDWPVYHDDPKLKEIAESLGIDVFEEMTGEELYNELQQVITQAHNPIYDLIRPSYDRYIGNRSVNSGTNMLYEAAQSDLVAEPVQDKIKEFMFKDEMLNERHTEDVRLPLADQNRMREEFMYIMNGAKDQKTDWMGIWKEQYERTYGPLEWTPPEPRSWKDADGKRHRDAIQPYIRNIVDGDTMLIQEYKGSPVLNSVRLLGVRAEEVSGPNKAAALASEDKLKKALMEAAEKGDSIYLVPDDRFGLTDKYGRMLAWLWIGDEPFYNPEDLQPTMDPGGVN